MSVKRTRSRATPGELAFDGPFVLLVEGGSDAELAAVQVDHVGGTQPWQVHDMGGIDTDWAAAVRVVRSDRWFREHGRGIALVVDADPDPAAA